MRSRPNTSLATQKRGSLRSPSRKVESDEKKPRRVKRSKPPRLDSSPKPGTPFSASGSVSSRWSLSCLRGITLTVAGVSISGMSVLVAVVASCTS